MKSRSSVVVRRKTLLLVFSLLFILGAIFLAVLRSVSSAWDGQNRLTIIIQISGDTQKTQQTSLALFTLDPQTKRALFLSIPPHTLLSVPYGFGSYPASSVYLLGELDDKKRGGELLGGSIERTIGVTVDSYMLIDDQVLRELPTSNDEVLKLKKQFFSFRGLFRMIPFITGKTKSIVTPLNVIDRWRLFWAVKRLRADQVTYIDATKLELLENEKRPDGSIVQVFRPDLFDLLLSDSFTDHTIRSLALTISIVNASGQALLAATLERILTHLGVNVISKSTAKEILSDRCLIRFTQRSKNESYLVAKLSRRWGCKLEEGKVGAMQSDIEITLGEAFVR